MKKIIYILIFVLSFFQLYAIDENNSNNDSKNIAFSFKTGLNFGYLYNFHNAKFMNLPNVPNCCLEYNGGNGTGFTFGGLLEIPIFNMLDFRLKINYLTFNDKMEVTEFIGYSQYEGQRLAVSSYHYLSTDFSFFSFTPQAIIKPFSSVNFFGTIGGDIGFKTNSNYTQYEKITDEGVAKGITFIDGATSRNDLSGKLESSTNMYLGINAGIGYEFKITDKLSVSPEINYGLALNDLVSGINWKTSIISANLAIKYQIDFHKQIEYIRDTVRVPEPKNNKIVAEKKYDQSELKNYACHYIVYSSFKTENEAVQIQSQLLKSGLSNLSVEPWNDQFSNKTFYRIRSQCFNSLYKANEAKNEQIKLLRNINLPNDPAIKSK